MATAVTSGVIALVMQAHNQDGYHKQKPLTPVPKGAREMYSTAK